MAAAAAPTGAAFPACGRSYSGLREEGRGISYFQIQNFPNAKIFLPPPAAFFSFGCGRVLLLSEPSVPLASFATATGTAILVTPPTDLAEVKTSFANRTNAFKAQKFHRLNVLGDC